MRDRERERADELAAAAALYGPRARPSAHLVTRRRYLPVLGWAESDALTAELLNVRLEPGPDGPIACWP